MCGRYVLALRYGQVHDVLEQHGLPADDFHEQQQHGRSSGRSYANDGQRDHQGADEDGNAQDAQDTDEAKDTGDAPFQPSYNFAPGYHGVILRPVFPTHDKQKKTEKTEKTDKSAKDGPHLQLQVMKWGLVPSWMKKRPDYATMLKTINCRADSLAPGSGSSMWASLRGRKRCIVVAQGFYEWLKTGPKERVPHYIRRRDGLPLLLGGLWDSVNYDGENGRTYTYTIITTDSNASLRFLHDRMPVVFDYQSPELEKWLDPARDTWTPELQLLLRPWPRMDDDDGASLIVDVVSKEVNKAGNSSPSFIVPVASASNKSNIANFFRGKTEKMEETETREQREKREKREAEEAAEIDAEQPSKRVRLASPLTDTKDTKAASTIATAATPTTPVKTVSTQVTGKEITGKVNKDKGFKATARTPSKKDDKSGNSQKITSFFGLKNG